MKVEKEEAIAGAAGAGIGIVSVGAGMENGIIHYL